MDEMMEVTEAAAKQESWRCRPSTAGQRVIRRRAAGIVTIHDYDL
jgi:hypothetical protein